MSRSTKQSYHHGDLAAALVAAATHILETGGEAALSLRAAARQAGVSQAAPYHHFRDKGALLAAVAAQGFRRLSAEMEDYARKTDSPAEWMRELGVGYVVFAFENPALFRLMFGASAGKDLNSNELVEAGLASYAMIEEACRNRIAASGSDMDPDEVTLAAWSLVHGLANLLIDGRGKLVAAKILKLALPTGERPWGRVDIERLTRQVIGRRIF